MARRSAAENHADPAHRALYLQKTKETYAQDIETGRRKIINDLTVTEKRDQQRQWRVNQARHRQSQGRREAALTPPVSPVEVVRTPRVATYLRIFERISVHISQVRCYQGIPLLPPLTNNLNAWSLLS